MNFNNTKSIFSKLIIFYKVNFNFVYNKSNKLIRDRYKVINFVCERLRVCFDNFLLVKLKRLFYFDNFS